MKTTKMFLTVLIVLLFISCGTQDLQSYSEAKENLIGSWILKGHYYRVLTFAEAFPHPIIPDGIFIDGSKLSSSSTSKLKTGTWSFDSNDFSNNTRTLTLTTESNIGVDTKTYFIKKVSKWKMVLQLGLDPSDGDLVFRKIKLEK